MKIKLRLKELRSEFGKTQAEISQLLNVKQNTYSQYENSQRQIPLELLVALAEYYNVSVDYILGLTENDSPM